MWGCGMLELGPSGVALEVTWFYCTYCMLNIFKASQDPNRARKVNEPFYIAASYPEQEIAVNIPASLFFAKDQDS